MKTTSSSLYDFIDCNDLKNDPKKLKYTQTLLNYWMRL